MHKCMYHLYKMHFWKRNQFLFMLNKSKRSKIMMYIHDIQLWDFSFQHTCTCNVIFHNYLFLPLLYKFTDICTWIVWYTGVQENSVWWNLLRVRMKLFPHWTFVLKLINKNRRKKYYTHWWNTKNKKQKIKCLTLIHRIIISSGNLFF